MTSGIDMIETRSTCSMFIAPSDFFSCELFNVGAGRDPQNTAQTEFSKSRFARMLSRSMKTGLFEMERSMKTWNVFEPWYDRSGRRGSDKHVGSVRAIDEADALAKVKRKYGLSGDGIKVYAPTLKVGDKVKRIERNGAKPFKIADMKPDGYILTPTPDSMKGTIADWFRTYEHERYFEKVA